MYHLFFSSILFSYFLILSSCRSLHSVFLFPSLLSLFSILSSLCFLFLSIFSSCPISVWDVEQGIKQCTHTLLSNTTKVTAAEFTNPHDITFLMTGSGIVIHVNIDQSFSYFSSTFSFKINSIMLQFIVRSSSNYGKIWRLFF